MGRVLSASERDSSRWGGIASLRGGLSGENAALLRRRPAGRALRYARCRSGVESEGWGGTNSSRYALERGKRLFVVPGEPVLGILRHQLVMLKQRSQVV